MTKCNSIPNFASKHSNAAILYFSHIRTDSPQRRIIVLFRLGLGQIYGRIFYVSHFTLHVFPLMFFCLFTTFPAFTDIPGELKHDLLKKVSSENLLRNPHPMIDDVKPIISITSGDRVIRASVQLNLIHSIAFSIKLLLLAPIQLHQKIITHQDGDTCTLEPSCSHYGAEAIRRHGLQGFLMASNRLLRCHSGNRKYYLVFNGVAYDPVPP